MSYQVIAKLKRNDVQAFNLLDSALRAQVRPIFELAHMKDDDDPAKHLGKALDALRGYKSNAIATVDLHRFAPGTLIHDRLPADIGYESILGTGRRVIPVVRWDLEPEDFRATVEAAKEHQRGLCVRLEGSDIVRVPETTVRRLLHMVTQTRIEASNMDLLLDFGKLMHSRDEIVLATLAFLRLVDGFGLGFRSTTFAGSTVVDYVTEAANEEHGSGSVVRVEFAAWMRISRSHGWGRGLRFADYGIVRPGHMDAGKSPHANAKIRYTAGACTHYIRGCSRSKSKVAEQFPELARRLVRAPYYKRPEFSDADKIFWKVAEGTHTVSELGRSVQLDLNHHVTYVARQLSALLALREQERSSDEQLDAFMAVV